MDGLRKPKMDRKVPNVNQGMEHSVNSSSQGARSKSQRTKKTHYHPNRYFRSRPPKKAMEMLVKVPIK